MKRLFSFLAALVLVIGFTISAHAILIERGGGLVYDTDFNITWLRDFNSAGTMNFSNATTWAANLEFDDSVRGVIWDDWRLPTALNQDGSGPCGWYLCIDGEFGHMYYTELGNEPYVPTTNKGPFNFITGPGEFYWTNTVDAVDSNYVWNFSFYNGVQLNSYSRDNLFYVVAVLDGDVGAGPAPKPGPTQVPEPTSFFLLGAGLVGLIAFRRNIRESVIG